MPRVKGLIRRRLQEGHTDFGRRDLASALNLSLRTLQRKLDQQGTHFQALFDQCRQDLALQLLQRGHQSLGEISYQLGFSGLPAFQKAFRRWTGTSPGQYRQRQNARPAGGENRRLSDYIGPSGLPETLFYPLALQLLDLLPLRLAETPNVAAAPHRFSVLTPGPEQWQLKWVDAPATDALNELEYSAPETSGLVPPTPGPAALLYSLGCLYHALLHGRPPHSATDLRTLLRSRQERPPRFDGSLGKPLRALLAQLLQPSPGARPRSFEAVRQRLLHCRWQLQGTVTPAALHPDVPTDSAPDLGTAAVRERDRATLAELLLQAEAGQGRLLLVMGATGSGKSTLLYGLVDELLPAQAIRLRLRFQPQARGAASPVTDLLRQLIHQHSAAPAMEYGRWRRQLRQLPPESLRQLGALLPETATLEGLLGETQNATPNTEQHPGALFGALLRLSLSDRPVVICLDDLHFADTAALTTLNMLTGLLEDAGLLIIGSCRTEDRPVASPFARQWPLLRQQARCRLLELAPLQPAEIRQLLTGLIVASATDLDALALHLGRETAGNPGRLLQSLRALQPRGSSMTKRPGAGAGTPPIRYPPTAAMTARMAMRCWSGCPPPAGRRCTGPRSPAWHSMSNS
ncbi:helix-turn-helix domain-containing protein [Marinobacterium aestuariivivens]|uniref:Helix-turn-helix domain-containing protein n=1 Tax=Marinobacterium aestuariivivens TaxID=1698799 RepID=A0ABW2A5G0_9GAMM